MWLSEGQFLPPRIGKAFSREAAQPRCPLGIHSEGNCYLGLPGWLSGEESACNSGDSGLIPGLGRSSGGGHGNRLQYSCLENSMDRRAWRATVHGGRKHLDMTEVSKQLLLRECPC